MPATQVIRLLPRRNAEHAAAARPSAPPAAAPAAASDAELEAIRAERDRALAKLKKTTEAAHELKRRFDEIRKAGKSEQTKRKALEAELSTARADAERQLSLEKTRLEGELDKAAGKLAEVEASAKATVERERERAAAELVQAQQNVADAKTQRDEADSTRVAAEVAFQESLHNARTELESKRADAEKTRQELDQLRTELSAIRASSDEALRDQKEQDSAGRGGGAASARPAERGQHPPRGGVRATRAGALQHRERATGA